MNQFFLATLAFIGGVFLAIQASLNANLGSLLNRPQLASVAQSVTSTLFALAIAVITVKTLPSPATIKQIPIYLWFTGGLFSVLGISLYYFTIPRLGLTTMISLGLFGQLSLALVAGHFGWLNTPLEQVTLKKLVGVALMLAGIMLIKTR
jgi:transporter family-2 protein